MELKIESEGKEHVYQVPETFDAMTQDNYTAAVEDFLNDSQDFPNQYAFLKSIIEPEVFKLLSLSHLIQIDNMINISEKFPVNASRNLIDSFKINGKEYHGYIPNFLNTSWEEFISCDQAALNGEFNDLIAVLYRQAKKNKSPEDDIRVPYTDYGALNRLELFKDLPASLVMAIVMNYFALREKYIVPNYPHVFTKKQTEPEDLDTESQDKNLSKPRKFSWLSLHNSISTEYFKQSQEMLPLPVKDVLNVLNAKIKQANESKRKHHN